MSKEELKPSIESLGEFGLIKHLTDSFSSQNQNTVLGIGDDCAVIARDDKSFTLHSTDLFIENIHFDLMYVPLKHLGFKVISASVSDVYAMNGTPEQVFVSLAFSSRFPLEAIEELYEGIKSACSLYKVDLAGGDTSSSNKGLLISVGVIGRVEKNKITYRKGAKVNDIIMVSGDLGRPYLGLQILEREKSVFLSNSNIQPELEAFDPLIKKQLMPEARFDAIDVLNKLDIIPSAMIDVSDGLASELIHLSMAGTLGCVVYEDKIPYHEMTLTTASDFGLSPLTCAMNGGEEYELLFSISPSDFPKIQGNPLFTPIGHFTESKEGCRFVDNGGQQHELKAQGWAHF